MFRHTRINEWSCPSNYFDPASKFFDNLYWTELAGYQCGQKT